MKRYIDGFVLPVKKKEISAYKKMAQQAGKIWIKHGALEYVESIVDDVKCVEPWGLAFPKMVKTKKDETIVLAYIVYKSKSHRDKISKLAMDELMEKKQPQKIPFDVKRMAYAGFETMVYKKNA